MNSSDLLQGWKLDEKIRENGICLNVACGAAPPKPRKLCKMGCGHQASSASKWTNTRTGTTRAWTVGVVVMISLLARAPSRRYTQPCRPVQTLPTLLAPSGPCNHNGLFVAVSHNQIMTPSLHYLDDNSLRETNESARRPCVLHEEEREGAFQSLPILAMAAALCSQNLKTKSENHTSTLSVWWCLEKMAREGSTFEDIQSFFDCLLQSLRFSRMSTEFLITVVVDCAWVRESHHYPAIIRQILMKCSVLESCMQQTQERMPCTNIFYTLWMHFSRAEIESLRQSGRRLQIPAVIFEVEDHPLWLQIIRDVKNSAFHISLRRELFVPSVAVKSAATWEEPVLQNRMMYSLVSLEAGMSDIIKQMHASMCIYSDFEKGGYFPFHDLSYNEEEELIILAEMHARK